MNKVKNAELLILRLKFALIAGEVEEIKKHPLGMFTKEEIEELFGQRYFCKSEEK